MRYQDKSIFPSPLDADEDGIVAFSTALNCKMLIDAYSHGIFPWPFGEGEQYIPWCSPAERGIIMIGEFHIPHGTAREMKKWNFSFAIDRNFREVITSCAAAVRAGQDGTWITNDIINAYTDFHRFGYAHSFEAYDPEGNLAGGLYGISIGKIFCGESMFYRVSGASKFAFIKMAEFLKEKGVAVIDTQMVTNLTGSFGAHIIAREQYIKLLKKYGGKPLF